MLIAISRTFSAASNLSDDEKFPVDASKMSSLVANLASVQADRTLENVDNLQDYGLDEPTNIIQIGKTDGSTETIAVGSKNPSTEDTYIYLNDEKNTVYTVATDFAAVFTGSIYDFAESEVYPTITSTTIQKITVDKDENSYTLESDGDSDTGWTVEDEKENKQEADATNAGTLQTTIAGLAYAGYYDYNCEDMSVYGLDKPRMELNIEYAEEVTQDAEEDAEGTDTSADASEEKSTDTSDTSTETVKKNLTLYIGNLNEEDGNVNFLLFYTLKIPFCASFTKNGIFLLYKSTFIYCVRCYHLKYFIIGFIALNHSIPKVILSLGIPLI